MMNHLVQLCCLRWHGGKTVGNQLVTIVTVTDPKQNYETSHMSSCESCVFMCLQCPDCHVTVSTVTVSPSSASNRLGHGCELLPVTLVASTPTASHYLPLALPLPAARFAPHIRLGPRAVPSWPHFEWRPGRKRRKVPITWCLKNHLGITTLPVIIMLPCLNTLLQHISGYDLTTQTVLNYMWWQRQIQKFSGWYMAAVDFLRKMAIAKSASLGTSQSTIAFWGPTFGLFNGVNIDKGKLHWHFYSVSATKPVHQYWQPFPSYIIYIYICTLRSAT